MNAFARTIAIAAVVLASTLSFAAPGEDVDLDRTEFRHDIHLRAGQEAADVTCFACSIYVDSKVSGDVTAFGGRIVVGENADIGGDVTSFLADIRVEGAAQIGGDVTALGGSVHRAAEAQIGGDVTSKAGTGWLMGILMVPLFFLGMLIALIVWLVQRTRRPVAVPSRA